MAAKGDALVFVSLSGHRYPAVLLAIHPSGRCSIDVDVGCREPCSLTMVRWRERPTAETFVAWPKEAEGGEEREAGGMAR
jgi:hypothetical protein